MQFQFSETSKSKEEAIKSNGTLFRALEALKQESLDRSVSTTTIVNLVDAVCKLVLEDRKNGFTPDEKKTVALANTILYHSALTGHSYTRETLDALEHNVGLSPVAGENMVSNIYQFFQVTGASLFRRIPEEGTGKNAQEFARYVDLSCKLVSSGRLEPECHSMVAYGVYSTCEMFAQHPVEAGLVKKVKACIEDALSSGNVSPLASGYLEGSLNNLNRKR